MLKHFGIDLFTTCNKKDKMNFWHSVAQYLTRIFVIAYVIPLFGDLKQS